MFITLVLASFIGSIMLSGIWKTLAIDFAILLISLKISYMLYSASKVSHFQFWILSSIEWRINQMEKELRDIQKSLKRTRMMNNYFSIKSNTPTELSIFISINFFPLLKFLLS